MSVCNRLMVFALIACFDGAHGDEVVATVDLEPPLGKVTVLVTEDAASVAQRITEVNGVWEGEEVLKIAKQLSEALQEIHDYTPPKDLTLKTGGAYSRRADEATKEKRFPDAISDCLRALMRPGLDSTAYDVFMKKLSGALLRMEKIREIKLEEEHQEKFKYAKEKEEADVLAKEWKLVLAEDEATWEALALGDKASNEDAVGAEEIVGVDIPLSSTKKETKGSGDESVTYRCAVKKGEDASHSAFHFSVEKGIRSPEEVIKLNNLLQAKLTAVEYATPKEFESRTAEEHLEKGKSYENDFEFGPAGAEYTRGLFSKTSTAELNTELSSRLTSTLGALSASNSFWTAWRNEEFDKALVVAADIPASFRSDSLQLTISRCHLRMGKIREAVNSLASLLTRCTKAGDWPDGGSCLIGATSGAFLALRVGDIEKAKKNVSDGP